MIPRLDISFPLKRQCQFWFGKEFQHEANEFLLNSARSGIVMALRVALPNGGRVGVMAYNCDSVYNAVYQAGCQCIFLDIQSDFRLCVREELELDAIVVTNLFGIKNDIEDIKNTWPDAVIIEDNAHGYGLKSEGDFAVYSINQGKYPALGPGGILVVNNGRYTDAISDMYDELPRNKSFIIQCKIFCSMMIKATLYHSLIYGWLTRPLKKIQKPKSGKPEKIVIGKMPIGVNRLYNAWINEHKGEALVKPFMDIFYTKDQIRIITGWRNKGIEADVHFRNWPLWAAHYGYVSGECPVAERLLNEVVMVPNYYKNSREHI